MRHLPRLLSHRRRRAVACEAGFTLVEMVIGLALTALVFTALAFTLGAALRTISVGKGRTQANEMATQGMEDLQRFSFDGLVLCSNLTPAVADGSSTYNTGTPPPPVPFGTLVTNGSCSATTVVESPCTPPGSGLTNPPAANPIYGCTRNGITYAVRRYIGWGDAPTDSVKRMAVVVDWTDSVGKHEITQQSSVRAPDQSSIIGAAPPKVITAQVSPNPVNLDSSGHLTQAVG